MEDIRKVKKVNIWKLLIYFILFSVVGFLLETIYAIFTKGMLESRKSFLYGPFCAIYGIAAVFMIIVLNSKTKNVFKVYFYGTIIGLFIEYTFSLFGEIIFHARWWDYSNNFGNINGRICLFYAVIWGLLSLILMYMIYPKTEYIFDVFYKKQSFILKNIVKILIVFTMIFLIINSIITSIALKNFITNICSTYNIEIKNFKPTITNKNKENFFTKYFSIEKMIMNYPNISVITEENEVLYLGSILHEYKNYYYSFENIKSNTK